MLCIKTGALVYLDYYGEVVRGDLFALRPNTEGYSGEELFFSPLTILLRVCERDVTGDFAHAFVSHVDHWFDEAKTSGSQNSTLIGTMSRFNYKGL